MGDQACAELCTQSVVLQTPINPAAMREISTLSDENDTLRVAQTAIIMARRLSARGLPWALEAIPHQALGVHVLRQGLEPLRGVT